jgi:hypothetical protein
MKRLNKKLEAFGFTKVFDGRSRVEYQRRGNSRKNFTQKVVIVVSGGEEPLLESFDPLVPDRERVGYRAVALTEKELKLFLKVMRVLKLKNELGTIGGLL